MGKNPDWHEYELGRQGISTGHPMNSAGHIDRWRAQQSTSGPYVGPSSSGPDLIDDLSSLEQKILLFLALVGLFFGLGMGMKHGLHGTDLILPGFVGFALGAAVYPALKLAVKVALALLFFGFVGGCLYGLYKLVLILAT